MSGPKPTASASAASTPLLVNSGTSAGGNNNSNKVRTALMLVGALALAAGLVAGGFFWGRHAAEEPHHNGDHPPPSPSPTGMPAFGTPMRELMFNALEPGLIMLNHGSYGAAPRPVLDAQLGYLRQMESNPCRFFSREVRPQMKKGREFFAPFVNASAEDIVWLENASGACNAILRSLPTYEPGKIMLRLSIAYGMVERTMQFIADRTGAVLESVDITLPVSPESIVAALAAKLEDIYSRNQTVVIASFSHISSTPALILPIQNLTRLCHARGFPVMIDGAHALGQIPIDLGELEADWYLSNGHKWLDAPKGAAFLHTKKERQPWTSPTVISFGYASPPQNNAYQKEFEWTGTKDLTPYLSMVDATKFLFVDNDINQVWKYQKDLCTYANTKLSQMWGTAPMTSDPRMFAAITNVELPDINGWIPSAIQTRLLYDYHMESVMYPWQNRNWTRVSCQIYNTEAEIDTLGRAVMEIIAKPPTSQDLEE